MRSKKREINIWYTHEIAKMFSLSARTIQTISKLLQIKKDSSGFYIFTQKDINKIKNIIPSLPGLKDTTT